MHAVWHAMHIAEKDIALRNGSRVEHRRCDTERSRIHWVREYDGVDRRMFAVDGSVSQRRTAGSLAEFRLVIVYENKIIDLQRLPIAL